MAINYLFTVPAEKLPRIYIPTHALFARLPAFSASIAWHIAPADIRRHSPRLLIPLTRGHNADNQHYVKCGRIGFRYEFRRFTGFSCYFDMGGGGGRRLVIFAGAPHPQKKQKKAK